MIVVQILGAVAIAVGGMLLISWLSYMDITKTGWRAAARELPRFAEQKGLEFEPSELSHEMGEVHGTLNGREVHLSPDDRATLRVSLGAPRKLLLATYAPKQAAPPDGVAAFETGDAEFDGFFESRFATDELTVQLKAASALHRLVGTELATFGRALRFCEVDGREVRCSVKYGQESYFPPKVLDELFPAMIRLADALDAALSGS